MPSGSYNPNASDYSKVQGGEIGADGSLRKIVKIGAVSAGVTMNVSGTLEASFPDTITVNGTVDVGNTVTVDGTVAISGTPSVSVANTVTVDGSVSISGTPSVSVANTVTVDGSVSISNSPTVSISGTPSVSVANTVTVDGSVEVDLVTDNEGIYAITLLSFSAASGSETVVSAPGSSTAIKVLGVMICNENTDAGRRFEFRAGSTAFVRGYVGSELPVNWNLVAHPFKADTNTAINVWANGTITAPITVAYTRV